MDLAEKLDPESWRELMNRFFQVLADAVHHADGTVDKFTGDGIMALFGAPIAREDHAQCACRAALEMIDGVAALAAEVSAEGIDLAVRIGINSGEVVVGSIGDEGEMEYTADRSHRRAGPADGVAGRDWHGLPDGDARRRSSRGSSS